MVNSNHRVLHVLDALTPDSGVANIIVACVSGISSIAQDVVVYGKSTKDMENTITSNNGTVYKLPHITKAFGKKFADEFSQLLKDKHFTIVHGHLLNSAFIYLKEAQRQNIKGRIIHAHSTFGADTFIKRIRNKALTQIAISAATDKIAVSMPAGKNAFGVNQQDVLIIGNGIDTKRFKHDVHTREQVREELGLDGNTICVGHVGRFAGLKNHSFLINVFRIMKSNINCKLLLVGDGTLKPQIERLVEEQGLSEHVLFLGIRSDVERFYQVFDVFLLPSSSEGFGLSAVEAQCSGLGCVVSENVPAIIGCSDGISFLSLKSEEEWANCAIKKARKPRSCGENAVIESGLDIGTMCENFSHLYERIISRK